MKNWEKVYKQNKDMVSREIDNELILMPIYKTNKDINEMYTMNETAKYMWDLIDGERTLGEIRNALCKHFSHVSPEEIEKDLEEFISDMKKINAIK